MSTRAENLFHEVADLPAEARARYFVEHEIDVKTQNEIEELLSLDVGFQTLEWNIGQVAQRALIGCESQDLPCGPYRLRSLLGVGGMGAVYLADRGDGDPSQRVAVKLLRPGRDHAQIRQRFLAERQILANLSHPNIAGMVDAGYREDGQPYLVMEYVEGQTIDVYTDKLSIRQKITLFLKVCSAVSYLHRNLVVHRDLKPANILIAADGEPKLLDFGIAKLLDLATDFTATNMRMLTPDYASPEQVSGGPITTATDIYLLGAVLYRVLTGVSPHQFQSESAGSVAMTILSGRITPPSRLVPIVNGDLEVVLMKALRLEPQERYPSVDAFAADLRACLEHRPVQARSGDVWYRTRRFFRAHWIPVAAIASVIIALSAGLYIADRQRRIAEQRFAQLRQLSNRVIDLDLAIRTLPGSIEARRRLVAASLEYLEGLAHDARGNLDLAKEISDGYWRMARIQGVNAELNLGDTAKADENLKKAEALIETVLAARPHDRNALFRSALIAHDRMIIAGDERRSESLVFGKHAAERLELFLRLDGRNDRAHLEGFLRPGDAEAAERRGASSIFANIGLAHVNQHLFEEGARYARRAVELAEPVSSAPDVAGAGLSILANALRYQGDLDGALRTIRQVRELCDGAQYPDETLRLFARYGPLLREGRILGERDAVNLGRFDEAAKVLQEAFELNENAAIRDPNDAASRSRIGSTARELGDVLRDRDPRRASTIFDRALQRTSQLPENPRNRRERAELLAKSAYPLLLLHRAPEAKKRIDSAVAALEGIHEYRAKRIVLGTPLYSVVRAVADYEAAAGSRERAVEAYEDLLRRTMESKPQPQTNLQDAARLSSLYRDMADANRRAGHKERAVALDEIRSSLWQQWNARLPNNDFVRRQLSAAGGRT